MNSDSSVSNVTGYRLLDWGTVTSRDIVFLFTVSWPAYACSHPVNAKAPFCQNSASGVWNWPLSHLSIAKVKECVEAVSPYPQHVFMTKSQNTVTWLIFPRDCMTSSFFFLAMEEITLRIIHDLDNKNFIRFWTHSPSLGIKKWYLLSGVH